MQNRKLKRLGSNVEGMYQINPLPTDHLKRNKINEIWNLKGKGNIHECEEVEYGEE